MLKANKEFKEEEYIRIWTDGACRFDSSKGGVAHDDISGYAVLIKFNGEERIFGEAKLGATNSLMELTAVLEGLRAIRNFGYPVRIFSDSMYVVSPLRQGWYRKWQRNGWKTSSGSEVKHRDIWEELISFWSNFSDIEIHHVKGHSGIVDNERVDSYVNKLMDELEKCKGGGDI